MFEQFNMYTNFVENTFFFTDFTVQQQSLGKVLKLKDGTEITGFIEVPEIQQINTTQTNIMGIIITFLIILGFILNRKDNFSQIAFVWCIFSFILLFLIGWGTSENGLILYTFYFSWAFICLIFKLIEKLLHKHKKIKATIYSMGILSMLLINFYGIYQTILFGIQYFKY